MSADRPSPILWLALAVACLAGAALAADGPPGKVALFDGKTLGGWQKADFFKAGEVDVRVEGGAIVLPVGEPMSGVTSTRKDLPTSDYELSYEARRTAGDDFFAAATFPVGKSHATLVNGGWGGSVTGLSSIDGADASENETQRYVKYKNGTWYRFRVRVTGDAVRAWVDDKETFAVDIRDRAIGTRIEVRENRPLGFAAWNTAGAVRAVEIRELTPEEVAANRKPED